MNKLYSTRKTEPWLACLCSINNTCHLLSDQILFSTTLLQQQSPFYTKWSTEQSRRHHPYFTRRNQSSIIVKSCPSTAFWWRYLQHKRCFSAYTWLLTTKCFIGFALRERCCVNIQFLHFSRPRTTSCVHKDTLFLEEQIVPVQDAWSFPPKWQNL